MRQAILLFTVVLICMMASSAFSTEARPYDPTRPQLSPSGDGDPWDDPKKLADDYSYLNNNIGDGGAADNIVAAIIGLHNRTFTIKWLWEKGNAGKKRLHGLNSKPAEKK